MNKKVQNLARLTWCDLCNAIQDVLALNTNSTRRLEKCCKRLVYNKDRNMVVIEIDGKSFQGLFGKPIETSDVKKILTEHANYDWVDAIGLGQLVYFYFGLRTDDENESIQVANLVYLV